MVMFYSYSTLWQTIAYFTVSISNFINLLIDFDIVITLPEFVATKADVELSLKDVAISGDDRVKVVNNEVT